VPARNRKYDCQESDDIKVAANPAIAVNKRHASSSGCIENVEHGVLKGWIPLPQGAAFDVYADGELVGTACATDSRPDVVNPHLTTPPRGFRFPLPHAVIDGDEHEFELRPAGQLRRPTNPLVRTLPVSLFIDAPTKVKGWIDGVRDGTLYGWYAAPTGSLLIISADDQYVGSARNTIPRDDVVAAGSANEPVGFEIELPDKLQDGAEHVFEIRVASAEIHSESLVRSLVVHKKPLAEPRPKRKTKAAVVCWDLGHNPAGRALVLVQMLERLYDEVHLIGPLFQRFGGKLWEPIVNIRGMHVIAEKVKKGYVEVQ